MQKFVFTLLGSVGLALAGLAYAQAPLTGDQIDRWMTSFQELQILSDPQAADDLWDDLDDELDEARVDLEPVYEELARSEPQVHSIIQRRGFRDGGEWVHVGNRILQAFLALEMADSLLESQDGIREAQRQIEQNQHLSDAQKAMMLEQLKQSKRMVDAHIGAVSEADMAAVRGKHRELRALLDHDED